MKSIKRIVGKTAFGKKLKKLLKKKSHNEKFRGSKNYWEERYKAAENSGAGSYGRLADFKAEILNDFVRENNIQTVLEFGVGDGNQLSLAKYPYYIGYDVSPTAIQLCKSRFKHDSTKEFHLIDTNKNPGLKAELVLSLDVLYHLIEDVVFEEYVRDLFASASRYVVIYSSNYDKQTAAHVRSRKFTRWIESNVSDAWRLIKVIKNKYPFDESNPDHTSISDFYIYRLEH